MIVYVSDSINSKKNGGSSTSGFEFLQFLRMNYSEVVLITSDLITEAELGVEFYDNNHAFRKIVLLYLQRHPTFSALREKGFF